MESDGIANQDRKIDNYKQVFNLDNKTTDFIKESRRRKVDNNNNKNKNIFYYSKENQNLNNKKKI